MRESTFFLLAPLALLVASPASATWYADGSWSTSSDEGLYEAFAHGVDDYAGTSNDLSNCGNAFQEFRGYLASTGYSNFKGGTDAEGWSTAWEESSVDDDYVDSSDFAYFCGHGSSHKAHFYGSGGDDELAPPETNWGEVDVEAIVFDSCMTLDGSGRKAFGIYSKNDGVHHVMGFHGYALDYSTTAAWYGYYLQLGYRIGTSWKTATRTTHSSSYKGGRVRFYSSSCDTRLDTAYSTACDPTSGSSYKKYKWTL